MRIQLVTVRSTRPLCSSWAAAKLIGTSPRDGKENHLDPEYDDDASPVPRLTLMLASSAALALALAADAEPNDSTLGKRPPEGAVVLFNGKGSSTAGSRRTASRPPGGRRPMA